MKVSVLQEDFIKALTNASRFTTNKVQLPILANILLTTSKNKLTVSATDLEISITTSIGAKVSSEGQITVPSRVLTEIVSNLKSGSIDISSEKEQITLKSSGFNSKISGMNSSEFPEIPKSVSAISQKVKGKEIKNALSKVLYSVSTDETRPVLTGVLVLFGDNTTLVATDGFRLSQKELNLTSVKKKKEEENKVIIPRNVLSELLRLVSDEVVEFSYSKKDNQIVFSLDNTVLSSRVIEGQFPDFKKIIPKDTSKKVNLDKEEFLRAIKLASVFARDSANVVKLNLDKESLKIVAESSSAGSQETKVDAKIEGIKDEFTIAFNYRFLEDFVNSVESDDLTIEMSEPNSPALFLDTKDTSFLHIIMPVRLQE